LLCIVHLASAFMATSRKRRHLQSVWNLRDFHCGKWFAFFGINISRQAFGGE